MTNPPVTPGIPGVPVAALPEATAPFDPLRLCIFATVALLGWALGPFALLFFAGLGFTGYWKARQGGLTRSRCLLRDTRLVLTYLAVLAVAAGVGPVAVELIGRHQDKLAKAPGALPGPMVTGSLIRYSAVKT